MANFTGTAGNDTFTGTNSADYFDLSQGGDDTIYAMQGNDVIYMGAALTAADRIAGGSGLDTLILDGDYSAGLTLDPNTIDSIDIIRFTAGHSYNLTISNLNFGDIVKPVVDASALGAGDTIIFNGAAETLCSFQFYGHAGIDTMTGGANADTFFMGANLSVADSLNGGGGVDTVDLSGDYSAGLTFGAATIVNIETLKLERSHAYNLTMNDANVAAGQTLSVDASSFLGGDALIFDGSAETDGSFQITSRASTNTLTGGAGNDQFTISRFGTDTINGGGGDDTITFYGIKPSTLVTLDGGSGTDTLSFVPTTSVSYATPFKISGNLTHNIEILKLVNGVSYNLFTDDSAVASGQTLTVDASIIFDPASFTFDGSAETDGSFHVIAGSANTVVTLGIGNDTVDMGANMIAADRIDGGAGNDTLVLNGNYVTGAYASGLRLGISTLANIETIQFAAGHSYNLIMNDGNVAAGKTLALDAKSLGFDNFLTFDGSAETNGNFNITAGSGNDALVGGGGNDVFNFSVSKLDTNDIVAGGGGNDTLRFTSIGTISASALSHVTGIEIITLANGTNNITLTDALVSSASGTTLTVNGNNGADTIDGSLVTTASNKLIFNGGSGADVLTGGAGDDVFNVAPTNLTSADTIKGGAGADVLQFSATGTIGSSQFAHVSEIERIVLFRGTNHVTLTDALVSNADGATLTVTGASGADTIDGSAVATASNEVIFQGRGGADTFIAGGGMDVFYFFGASDSTGTGYDTVSGCNFATDLFNVPGLNPITGVDAALAAGALDSGANFDTELTSAMNGHLGIHHAELFTPDSGTLSGQTFLIVDLNGTAGYQSGQDLVIHMVGATGTLATTDFI